jgi:hypothetical protein
LIALGVFTVPPLWRLGIRPSPRLAILVALLWVAWLAAGFPVNQHNSSNFHVLAEVMNETAKTAWALAYLWPIVSRFMPMASSAVRRSLVPPVAPRT